MSAAKFGNISDKELLDKFYESRDNFWLGILLERYTLMLLGVCMKYLNDPETAKDAVQQILLKAIVELQKYEVAYIKSWIYTIARNHCLMQLRDKTKYVSISNEFDFSAEEINPNSNFDKELWLQYLEQALPALNEAQKTCVTLFYLERNTYQEISFKTGFSLLQVKSHIQNGKRNLKILIQEQLKKH